MGTKLSKEFKISKAISQGFSLSPILFKNFEIALKQWLQTSGNVGLCIRPTTSINNVLFTDDQVITVQNNVEVVFTLQKLHEEYQK